jgi:hypothetical protein
MVTFATEFPVAQPLDRAAFVAQIISWLRGSEYSTVLDDHRDADIEGETAYLRSRTGEELRLREFCRARDLEAIGFRHDFPDNDGRVWRTEAVVRRGAASHEQALMRLRTQCIAREPGARLEAPRKPYLVKAMLRDGWGGKDGILHVTDQPLWLTDEDSSLQLARDVTLGRANRHLPVVFVSATATSRWLLSRQEVEKLAYDLGGVAHVVVEPSRTFSFRLRDQTAGANAYGGTLGIALPGRGIVRRLHLGWQLQDSSDLLTAARLASMAIRSQMPAVGWDWTELQEQALRLQRERDRSRLSAEESEKLYLEEIENLKDRIRQLDEQLAARARSEAYYDDDDRGLPEILVARLGPEVYPGEFSDRLRLAAKLACAVADQVGLDRRSKALLEAAVKNLPSSPALLELLQDLKRATKDPRRAATELTALLLRHGYREKSENRHIRLEAKDGYTGLDAITLPKTPSDSRGLTNLRKQIERTLGIAKLLE